MILLLGWQVSGYRQFRFKHHYKGLHYGLLTLIPPSSNNNGDEDTKINKDNKEGYVLQFDLINHLNESVFGASIPLLTKNARDALLSSTSPAGDRSSIQSLTTQPDFTLSHNRCKVVPYHGVAPAWRVKLAEYGLFILPACMVFPLIGMLWYILHYVLLLMKSTSVDDGDDEEEQEEEEDNETTRTREEEPKMEQRKSRRARETKKTK